MAKAGEKADVFLTTKVRTKLKGDNSWLQRRSEPQAETKEKPWIAEVKACRENGTPPETTQVSPTKSSPLPTKSDTERAPPSGYLIRGVFTKLDKPTSSSTSNGLKKTTQTVKKPSDGYRKIAPHTVRSFSENQEGQLSKEEQEKRTEAASNVLMKSAVRQRSYVLSAAKKYESREDAPTSPGKSTTSFVAKRVEITDDDENATTPAPASSPPSIPVVPVTSVVSAPEPKPWKMLDTSVKTAVDVTVNEPMVPKEEEEGERAAPEPVKQDPPPEPLTETDPFEHMTPGCTKVATPLPELILECVQAVCTESDPEDSPLDEPAPVLPPPASPPPASNIPESPDVVSAVTVIPAKTGPEPEPEPEPEPAPKPSSTVDTLTALSDTLISFDTSSTSFKDDEPALAEEEGDSVDSGTRENDDEEEPFPEISNCVPMTDDLLFLSDGPEASAEPVPPSPGHWSQDLLFGVDSESDPAKTSSSLDLLAHDVITINTAAHSLKTQGEEEKQTEETAEEMQSSPPASSTETVTISTKTVIITDKSEEDGADPWSSSVTTTVSESSSADPFDPYPIGTTSPNSSSDLLQPLSDISINSMSSNALESLAGDVIPINTDTTSLSTQRTWVRVWETSAPPQTEERQDAEPEGQDADQRLLVMFERKSTENDSPWDRWTSPTVYTITTGEEEEEEEEEEGEEAESPEDTQTVTTITTIREIHREPEPAMDRYETYSNTVIEQDQRAQTPEPEAKKGLVLVKEYLNATELSLHNARDSVHGGSDYLTSSSASYSYSPTTYSSVSLSSTCTYCGELVGNDAKISIEHLNINCHPACFKCHVCSKPMGDLLHSMFLHGGKVNCESCYTKAFE